MPEFAFEARDRQGASHTGTLQAVDASTLADVLRQRGWLPVQVRAVAAAGARSATASSPWTLAFWFSPRSIDVEVCLQQIATMLRSGLTLLTALDTVARQCERRSMSHVWRQVARRIEEGSDLADAMASHKCFSRLVIQLVRVGEQTGTLDDVLSRAADALEARRLLRTSLITSLIYPALVVVMAIGVASFMVIGVIPKVERVLRQFGRRLPWMTQVLMDISVWVNANLMTILILLGAAAAAVIVIYMWPPGRLWMDRAALRVPIVGRMIRLAATASFAHTLGTLIRSGVTVLESLRTVQGLHRNHYLSQCVDAARQRVLEGGSLADPLGRAHAYMPMLAGMVGVGETSGTLDDTLDAVAVFHEKQLQSAIKRFSAIIEPVIILVVGGIVGFVYIAFFMALLSFAGGVH